jgi:hypothetical protein
MTFLAFAKIHHLYNAITIWGVLIWYIAYKVIKKQPTVGEI